MIVDHFHQAVVPVFDRGLSSLAGFLAHGVAALVAEGHDEAAVLEARLAPDMLPLRRQVQIATDHAKGASARLAGVEPPRYADDETSVEALGRRIERTRSFVASIPRDAFTGAAERAVSFKIGGSEFAFTGADYAHSFALPNFYFHLATAYGILRHLGAPLGKRDFLGRRERNG